MCGNWADIFWFSLFHEIGHVLLHDRRHIFLENRVDDPQWKKQEEEADAFARDTLIPTKSYAAFAAERDFTQIGIKTFSKQLQIDPGIVVGRLQHDGLLPQNRHGLRTRYQWA